MRESSFNMTLGGGKGGGMKMLRGGGFGNFLDTRQEDSDKIRGVRKFVYFKTNRRGVLLKN